MTINIQKINDRYIAEVTPPHGKNSHWKSAKPMPADSLIKELLNLGCHQTDIGDAFHMAEGKSVNIPHPLFERPDQNK